MTSEELLKSIDRVKIVCKEGILRATKIYTMEGQEIRVTDLKLHLTEDGIWLADLTMFRTELDLDNVLVGQKRIKCMYCKREEDISAHKIEDSKL